MEEWSIGINESIEVTGWRVIRSGNALRERQDKFRVHSAARYPLLHYSYLYDTLASLMDSDFRVGRSGPVASDGPGFEQHAAPGG